MTYGLGRIPSPPDERDWKLGDFLTDPVAAAVAELQQTTVGYKNKYWSTPPSGTHWYKALALLGTTPPPPPPPTNVVNWENPEAVLDQGDFGTCVGNGWAQWGNTLPIDDKFDEKAARAIYYESTIIGGSPDDPDAPGGGQQGSTVRDGAKAMQKRGRLSAYAFASSTDEITTWISSKGVVVAGTDWYDGMFNPNSNGVIKPTGSIAGGHCYVLCGVDTTMQQYKILNSWGEGWGLKGYARILISDFAKLLAKQGEACVSIELDIS